MATCIDLMAPHRPGWKFWHDGKVIQEWDSNGQPMYDVGANGYNRDQWSGGFGRVSQRDVAKDLGYNESEIWEMYMDGTLEEL